MINMYLDPLVTHRREINRSSILHDVVYGVMLGQK